MRFHLVCALSLFLSACAHVTPNPNVGERTVDMLLTQGDCAGATERLRRAAERGQPWAQVRLGFFAYTKQCPGIDLDEGNTWLTKVACYEARSDWEKGRPSAMGTIGFFNTREDSYHAVDVLQMAAEGGSPDVESMLVAKWYWIKIAADLYEPGHPRRRMLDQRLRDIEKNMTADTLSRARALDICGPFRAPQT